MVDSSTIYTANGQELTHILKFEEYKTSIEFLMSQKFPMMQKYKLSILSFPVYLNNHHY